MRDEGDELRFSPEASANRSIFYQGLNDINLFIEDTDKEYEYETIFKRLLGKHYSISAIFALGGKPNVISKYKEFGEATNGIPNYYIVDGDFDRYVCPNEMVVNSHFIYLEAYNIESYFLDKTACERFAKGKLRCLDNEVEQKVSFKNWLSTIIGQATKLFLCYCFLKKYHPEIERVSRSPYKFIDEKTGLERTDGAYNSYEEGLRTLDPDFDSRTQDIIRLYEGVNGTSYFNLICGKFLLTSLYCHLRAITRQNFRADDLRWYLIENFDTTSLNFVKNAILSS